MITRPRMEDGSPSEGNEEAITRGERSGTAVIGGGGSGVSGGSGRNSGRGSGRSSGKEEITGFTT